VPHASPFLERNDSHGREAILESLPIRRRLILGTAWQTRRDERRACGLPRTSRTPINQRGTDHRADAGDRAQAREVRMPSE
jgi:hypothetical protein